MADFFSLVSTLQFALKRQQPIDGGSVNVSAPVFGGRVDFANGTGALQCDEQWFDTRSLAVGNEVHDLQTLVQNDADGGVLRPAISFQGIKGFAIENTTAVSVGGHLLIGAAVANPWDGGGAIINTAAAQLRLNAGGTIMIIMRDATGMPVTATESDLRIESVGQTQTYNIDLVGLAT